MSISSGERGLFVNKIESAYGLDSSVRKHCPFGQNRGNLIEFSGLQHCTSSISCYKKEHKTIKYIKSSQYKIYMKKEKPEGHIPSDCPRVNRQSKIVHW